MYHQELTKSSGREQSEEHSLFSTKSQPSLNVTTTWKISYKNLQPPSQSSAVLLLVTHPLEQLLAARVSLGSAEWSGQGVCWMGCHWADLPLAQ